MLCRGSKMTDIENDPTPHLTGRLLAALSRPGRFFIAVPSAEMNEREIKQRASELRDLQRENEHGAGNL